MRFFSHLRYILLLVSSLLSNGAVADNDSSVELWNHLGDSLKQELRTPSLTEKEKMEIYYKIATMVYSGSDQDSVVAYGSKAIDIARRLGEDEREMELYRGLGVAYCFKGNYDTAIVLINRAKEISIKRRDKNSETGNLGLIAFTYAKQGKYNTAIGYYLEVLKIAESEDWVDLCVGALVNLSEINRRLGNTAIAIQYLVRAEEKSVRLEKPRYTWRMPHIYNEFACNYIKQGDLDKAIKYLNKSDSINNLFGSVNKCYTKSLLATAYLQQNDYDRALQYAKESYEQADVLKDRNLYTNARKILSDTYLKQQRYAEAEAEALQAWLSDSTYIDESRGIAENIVLANIYLQHTEKAAYYFHKYSELNKQYSEKSFQITVSDLAIQYETEKKEMRISSLEQQKVLYIFLSFVGVLLAIMVWGTFRQKIRRERTEKQLIANQAVFEGEKRERERVARDLHDGLGGMLSSIKIELNAMEHLQNIRDRIDDCIESVRRMARGMMPVSLQRYGMKAALEDYCRLFLNVHFHYFGKDERIDKNVELMVYYCTYELVNNSIKHSGATAINVQLIQEDDRLSLSVQDDGCGFDKESAIPGAGLRNISDRVAACNGKMDIFTSFGNGTEVTIEINLQNTAL